MSSWGLLTLIRRSGITPVLTLSANSLSRSRSGVIIHRHMPITACQRPSLVYYSVRNVIVGLWRLFLFVLLQRVWAICLSNADKPAAWHSAETKLPAPELAESPTHMDSTRRPRLSPNNAITIRLRHPSSRSPAIRARLYAPACVPPPKRRRSPPYLRRRREQTPEIPRTLFVSSYSLTTVTCPQVQLTDSFVAPRPHALCGQTDQRKKSAELQL